ncbi:MAG: FMN-binding negative transcriptional regulator [Lysobacteraceae bacterium]
MKRVALFEPAGDAPLRRLVAAHPFALVVSAGDGVPTATPLPLLWKDAERGSALVGHFARANPQVEALRRDPRALVVFTGAQGYVSPSWLRDRTQAPTWNYETVHFEVEIAFDDTQAAIDDALGLLVAHMERDRPAAWSAAEMGARYASLSRAVIAFEARILATHAKFKLGQNERADVRADILAALADGGGGDPASHATLLAAMRRVDPATPAQP